MDNDIPKRTRKKATTAEEPTIDEASWWNDGRLSKITGLFLLFSALVMLIAFGSHVFTAASDQSDLLNRATRTLSDNSLRVHNRMGRLGAVLSYFFIDSLFGFSAILIALLLFVVGYNLFFQQKTFGLLRWFIYSFFAINWISATFAYVNWLIYPSSAISWGGGYGRFLAGETGFFTTLLEPLGTGILLGALALGAFIWIYNYDFSKWLKAKGNQPAEEIAADEADTFRDESENIFAKDKLQEIVASTAPPFELEEEKEETDFYVKNKQVNKPVANHDLEIETNEIDEKLDEHLDLQLNDISEEVLGETKGSIGTTYDPTMSLSNFKLPKLELLDEHGSEKIKVDPEELERNKNQIVSTLSNYAIEISKIKATIGPTVTLYEIVPAPGVRISKIKNLEDDIALSLAALGIRIIAPIPGKGTIGIEVPNVNKEIVSMRSLLQSEKFQNTTADLPICLGKSISNEIMVADLAKMPHLLMAGATGQGKSVGINAILVSLLYKKHPSELKFVMVDPKKVELSLYELLEKYYLAKLPGEEEAIITDTKKVVTTLNALCIEMDNRYELLKKAQVRNLKEYNHKFVNRKLNPQNGHQFLPYIVLVVDEFADLIMTAGKEVEMPIARLAQLARAIGIHLILATQRPSVNIITGTIKANFPARIAFKTTSKIDSRTILDTGGAEQLIGRGDMLLSQGSDVIRLQCGFVDTPEVERIRDFITDQQGFDEAFLLPEYIDPNDKSAGEDFGADGTLDELFEDAARVIVQNQMGSTSLIQRRLKLGYNRAGRLMDQLESAGIVGENLGSKARDVRVKTEAELEEIFMRLRER
jgi:S-DNA-T family DNA segregation ATPase FtsK/SpoIIIE